MTGFCVLLALCCRNPPKNNGNTHFAIVLVKFQRILEFNQLTHQKINLPYEPTQCPDVGRAFSRRFGREAKIEALDCLPSYKKGAILWEEKKQHHGSYSKMPVIFSKSTKIIKQGRYILSSIANSSIIAEKNIIQNQKKNAKSILKII